jgi:magnesium transporter
MPVNINTLKSKSSGFSWLNVISAQKAEIDYLRKKFKFDSLDLKDSYAKNIAQRPKFYWRSNYCFLLLQFPVFNRQLRTIDAEEVNFFVGQNYLITAHRRVLPPLVEFFNLCESDKFYSEQYLNGDNLTLLYEIIVRLQEYCYPIMDHVSLDVQNIEKNIFAGREREMVKEILLIKRNILNFRKIMEAHKDVLQKLTKGNGKIISGEKMKVYYNDLIEHTKDIWDILNGQKEMIEALEDTNTSLISFKLSDIMRLLTIFSVTILPLSLLAGIFGMNITNAMPLVHHPLGFWVVIITLAIIALSMFLVFKRKRWL